MFTVLEVLIRGSTRRKCRKGGRGLQSHITRLREGERESDDDDDDDGDVIIG
jgi:hypothetical protein